MNELRGRASARVSASASQCLGLLLDIEGYPRWYPDVVRRVEVVRAPAEQESVLAWTTVHFGLGRLRRDFDLLMEIATEAGSVVRLTRVPHDAGDPEELSLTWRIEQEDSPDDVRLTLELSARLEVPRLLPLHGLGDSLARAFLSAAQQALGGPAG